MRRDREREDKDVRCGKVSSVIKRWMLLLIMMMILGTRFIDIQAAENKVIKVGYIPISGFTEYEEGIYTGYAYEYLMEIAKYTGWEYEMIEVDPNDLIYKLTEGEIDLAPGILKNEQTEMFCDFPEESAGYTYTTLSVLKENDRISSAEYKTFNGIKVGYYENQQNRLAYFNAFCEENSIKDIELVAYADEEEDALLKALEKGEVDAIIGGDLLVGDKERIVAKFKGASYYFATTKGNKEIVAGINEAIYRIKQNNPYFAQELYNKYFKKHTDTSIYLTKEEKNYIQHMKPLKAVYVDNFAPMQDYNPKTNKAEGIYIDLIDVIAQRVGLKYELVKADNYKDAYKMIKNKEVDIIISASNHNVEAQENEYTLTQGYFEVNMVKVFDAKQKEEKERQTMAIPVGYFVSELKRDYEMVYYDTIEECLIAVKEGKADVTYGNSYTISRYLSSGYYPNLSTFYEEQPLRATIGIAKPTNLILMNIINKAISSLSESELQNIAYTNTINIKAPITLRQFFFDNMFFCIGVIILFIGLIYIVIRARHRRLIKEKQFLLEKSQIDPLTGVYNRSTGIDLVTQYLEVIEPSVYWALMIIDVDYFKQINDCLGHQAGDSLLIEFGQLLKQIFSSQTVIFRLGGDEFVIFMKDLKLEDFETVEDKLSTLSQLMDREVDCQKHLQECKQKISLSIGGVITNQIDDFSKLYQEADQILYEVKRNGRNGFKVNKKIR